jgi:hypothetical protein
LPRYPADSPPVRPRRRHRLVSSRRRRGARGAGGGVGERRGGGTHDVRARRGRRLARRRRRCGRLGVSGILLLRLICLLLNLSLSNNANAVISVFFRGGGGLIQKAGGGGRGLGGSARALQRSAHLATGECDSSAPAVSCSGVRSRLTCFPPHYWHSVYPHRN